jgi:uncharacterized phiE125 gp8 family phage protein
MELLMALVLTSAPAAEPVTLAEAKAHLRLDHAGEDALIATLITTARLHIEAALGLALITQSWSYRLDAWPSGGSIVLPLRPVQSMGAVRVTAADGTVATLAPEGYLLDGASVPPRLVATAPPWPRPGLVVQGIEMAFTAGYGNAASAVPPPIRQALLLLVAHWYEHREPVLIGGAAAPVPDTVATLLAPYRMVRL